MEYFSRLYKRACSAATTAGPVFGLRIKMDGTMDSVDLGADDSKVMLRAREALNAAEWSACRERDGKVAWYDTSLFETSTRNPYATSIMGSELHGTVVIVTRNDTGRFSTFTRPLRIDIEEEPQPPATPDVLVGNNTRLQSTRRSCKDSTKIESKVGKGTRSNTLRRPTRRSSRLATKTK